ncbi:damage-inducible protein DinB [Pedobacter yulinensis]|uniref:Damage-inducible protein DinB n=1 Tax=Pedobacter yulinensis TaxID=2126353 RepID=A0A2T3HMY3_9SPHI|nr:DinB family protein [Pedobacter yulinensis]PST83810.1 damage-inducible protein DinB [Pedobacter yulinensis]
MKPHNNTPAYRTIGSLMKNYASYNQWANQTFVNWLQTKPAALLEQEVASSFSSISQTLRHIWETQDYWLNAIKRRGDWAPGAFSDDTAEILAGIARQSAELSDYINAMEEQDFQENNLLVSPWFQSDFENFEYVLHCMTHSAYHRGQIVTMGRNVGITDAPMTDYNFFNVYVGKIVQELAFAG